jgi:hypothetical protein
MFVSSPVCLERSVCHCGQRKTTVGLGTFLQCVGLLIFGWRTVSVHSQQRPPCRWGTEPLAPRSTDYARSFGNTVCPCALTCGAQLSPTVPSPTRLIVPLEEFLTTPKCHHVLLQQGTGNNKFVDCRCSLLQPVQPGIAIEHFDTAGLQISNPAVD